QFRPALHGSWNCILQLIALLRVRKSLAFCHNLALLRWAQNWTLRTRQNNNACKVLVRKEGLEPSRFYPPDPKSGASANSATFALVESITCQLLQIAPFQL